MIEYIDTLKKCKLFDGVKDPDDILKAAKCLGSATKHYPKNEMIVHMGTKIDRVGVLLKGKLIIIKEDALGNRHIVDDISESGIFAESFVCAQVDKIPVSVQTLEKSTVLYLGMDKIITICSNACAFHQTIIKNLIKIIAKKNVELNQKIEFLSIRTTREKLLHYLLVQQQKQKKNPFTIRLNRIELADYLCIDRSAMSRELSRMKKDGILDYYRNTFTINFNVIPKM